MLVHGGPMDVTTWPEAIQTTKSIESAFSRFAKAMATAFCAAACSSISEPARDPRAEKLQPPPVYSRWWSMTESCSGVQGRMSNVSWYQVPGSDVVDSNGEYVAGYWGPVSNSIVLAGNGILFGDLVRHEMLHALLRQQSGHSRVFFVEHCAGIVSCGLKCLADAGRAPSIDPMVQRVSSSVLELSVSVVPQRPQSSVDGGVFTIIVAAHNPNPYPVVVTWHPPALNKTFFYSLVGPAGSNSRTELALDAGVTHFGPGATKRHYFDLSIGNRSDGRTVRPGTYTLHGGYDNRRIEVQNFVIAP
jgi:hypothetical protein